MDDKPAELTDGPYSTKWMAGVDKQLIKAAAKRAHRTQGDWLGEAAREKEAREREPFAARQEVILPPRSSLTLPDPGSPLSMHELAEAAELAARLRALQEEKRITARVARGITRVLESRLGMRPIAPRALGKPAQLNVAPTTETD